VGVKASDDSNAKAPEKEGGVKFRNSAIAITGIATVAVFVSVLRGQEPPSLERSVWDGVYTEEQARRGEALYEKQCSVCHGDKLAGRESAPPLTGGAFLSNWNGLTLGDLFERVRKTMPQNAPGKLSRQQNADILAYVLSFNKFPAGKTELYRQAEMLKEIRFEAAKPETKK
jgi:S-disulfanyl-L-cysteine oxidoreductase SoxD